METTFNFTYFYWVFFFCMLTGVFSAIFKRPVERVLQHVDESASGRGTPFI